MAERLGAQQRKLLATLCGLHGAIVVGDAVSNSLVRRGLLIAEPDGSFAHITAAGLRCVADEIDAGRLTLYDLAELRRQAQ